MLLQCHLLPSRPFLGSQRTCREISPASARALGALSWQDVEDKTSRVAIGDYAKLPPGSRPSTAPAAPGRSEQLPILRKLVLPSMPGYLQKPYSIDYSQKPPEASATLRISGLVNHLCRVLTTSLDSLWSAGIDETHPVLLIRDTEAWCPYCQRVWLALEYKGIDYDTMFINLRDKPQWFLELVPKGLVPVAKIKDKLLPESFEILKVLEEQFPEPSLLPKDEPLKTEVLRVCDECNDLANSGFGFMREGRLADSEGNATAEETGTSGCTMQSKFEGQLEKLEEVLRQNGGPFIMGEQLTLADVMYVPSLERFAAQLPVVKGFPMRDNPSYPGLARWYEAMEKLPAYQKVKGDDRTTQLFMKKVFGVKHQHVPELGEHRRKARLEAAAKVCQNHDAVVNDILKNSGIVRVRSSQYGGTTRAFNGYPSVPGPALVDAVDHALRRVCHYLVEGTAGDRHECVEACAIGSAALNFFRNRISAPRDVSAAAAEELRNACSQVLLDMF